MTASGKIIVLLCLSLFLSSAVFSQGTWTWVSGDSALNSNGVYGTQGLPSIYNHPPGLYEACEWKDKQGNFWLYGGLDTSYHGDLWRYNPNTMEWTWMNGGGIANPPPSYGTQGIPNSSNTPGYRAYCSASWVDTAGNLWLFGGLNNDFDKNDLWIYNINNNEWTWMKGDSLYGEKGNHGLKGVPGPVNEPGSRNESCSAWTDSLNNLWLFGGYGLDENGNDGMLNDVCKYDIAANEWTWMAGSKYDNVPAAYGSKGIESPGNDPGGRMSYTKWKDLDGNFWIMGGEVITVTGLNSISGYTLNDVWKYDVKLNEWTWMNGPSGKGGAGYYGPECVLDSLNMPAPRMEQRSSVTDNCGKFWMFGGDNSADTDTGATLNDLWQFDSHQLKWKLASGTNGLNLEGNYGSMGVPSPANIPPPRLGGLAWWGNDNKLYLFGGYSESFNTYSDMWVFNPDTTCTPCAEHIPPPVANFQSSNSTICTYDCISFTNLSISATSYEWLFSGALDSVSTDANPQNICYENTGTYNVSLIASGATGADTVTFHNYISVNPSPSVPVITQRQDTLFCSTSVSFTSYQWYGDSNLITNATDTFLVIPYGGNYNVKVTNEFGCAISAGVNVLGIKDFSLNSYISLYPNPVSNELLIKTSGALREEKIEIYNVLGQIVLTKINIPLGSAVKVNVSMLSSGVYFLHITIDTSSWMGKFVKE